MTNCTRVRVQVVDKTLTEKEATEKQPRFRTE